MSENTQSDLVNVLRDSKRSFYFTAFISLFINLLMLVPPLYMLQLYDRVLSSRSEETLLMLTLIVVALFIFMGLLEYVRSKILIRVANGIDARINTRLFNAIFTLALRYPSRATAQPINDIGAIRQFLGGTPIFAFFDAPWIPVYLAILFLFHPLFGWFGVFSVITVFALTILNEKRTKKGIEESSKHFQESQAFIQASLRNTEVIEAMGMYDNIRRIWQKRYTAFLNEQSDASDEAAIWSNASKLIRMMLQSLILGVGAYLAIIAEITPGMMIAGSIILGRTLAPIDLMTNTWKVFSSARLSYRRLHQILSDFPEKEAPMQLPAPAGKIAVENLTLIPPGSNSPVLHNINLQIEAGETIGIIGPSAAGKSSLARAVLGVWQPHTGAVRIDGAQISHYERGFLGDYIGYLPQDIELFNGTIAENIARNAEPDSQKVIDAAMMCGLHEMILKFPNGYDTPVGIGGASLSGGQRQRIGLARAVYGMPKIVVLDEPNSNLDDTGERALVHTIVKLKEAGSTVLLVTHRPAILGIVDKILLLREGTVQLFGPKDEVLMALQGKAQPIAEAARNG